MKEKTMNKETGEKRKHKLIHIDKQIDRQTDRQIDRHISFIDMRYNTEQYSKSNSIELNRIKSNPVNWNLSRIKQNRLE